MAFTTTRDDVSSKQRALFDVISNQARKVWPIISKKEVERMWNETCQSQSKIFVLIL
jgi:hypothetical protein